ncbi:hypothetical protein GC425_09355 [Corynebacterium sp. zg254]|uniref:Secreted protein n=1 Tax=Corynebacterium zhongnanshanii TaxID=2768834 RepID=A0ABQ6VHH2_9CORY|nr:MULTISPECIES: DUF6114 domain-containing protein [Corynebacterium]KAB3519195.1 hypothetical protein F8377_09385 [Corynebacterium zhongnanshanii]MCR5915047.1 hypothetical protein [Corynebacterium sp. zg254]
MADTNKAALKKRNRRFARWRSRRPFAGGLLQLMAGIIILTPAYASFEVSNFIIQISAISGVSTMLIGALLIVCGLCSWFTPDTRILTGVAGMLLGIVALPMSNIGGFVVGTLCAVIGSALVLSWTSADKSPQPDANSAPPAEEPESDGVVPDSSGADSEADSAATVDTDAAVDTSTDSGTSSGKSPGLRVLALLTTLGLVAALAVDGRDDSVAEAQVNLPALPRPEDLPKPEDLLPQNNPELEKLLPPAPALPLPNANELIENPPIDVAPPEDIQGEMPLQYGTYVIQTDSTALKGKVRMSLIQQNTPNGPAPALRIDADKAVLDNLRVQMPGVGGIKDMNLSSGPGEITTLSGNFHIVVRKITISPELAGVPTFPITIDASMTPEQITQQLAPIGLGLGEEVSDLMVMKDCYIDTYFVKADYLEAPLSNRISE